MAKKKKIEKPVPVVEEIKKEKVAPVNYTGKVTR